MMQELEKRQKGNGAQGASTMSPEEYDAMKAHVMQLDWVTKG